MKRKKPNRPRHAPPPDGECRFIVGTVEKITYHEPIPPGGSKFKYVRGQGLVYVGPREAPPIEPER